MTQKKMERSERNKILTNVTFRLVGDEIVPEEITQNLNKEPYKAWRKGDIRSQYEFTTYYTFGCWSFRPDCSKYLKLEQQLTILMDELDQLPPIIFDYVHKFEPVLLINQYSGEEQIGFHFYRDIVQRLYKYNLEIDLGVYTRPYYSGRIFTARYIRQRKGYKR